MNIDIAYVARLARLELSPAEAARLGAQLGRVLDYVAQLEAVDTEGVPPTTHPLPRPAPLREDVVAAPLERAEVLSQAPAHDGRAFAVPRVV